MALKVKEQTEFETILLFAGDWVKTQMKTFTSEDLRLDYYLKNDTLKMANPTVFGSVFRVLNKRDAITKNGFTTARAKRCRNGNVQLWISREYRLKQQGNRLPKNQTQFTFGADYLE